MALEGKFDYRPDQLPMDAYRDWQLCQVVGPPDTWADLPAERLDWILAVDDVVQQARTNLEEEAARG
ncbi:hypothetical protein [Streptomyces sp. MUM 16J]|uniref:hypothetical protein n=1 Tax=Streptomyces sp. MUM 16J TaxID=2791988 RepID=UPI001F04B197|nr:hypothetical protein [Streptomyces sp. MUM 16J]MCH0555818.1 hypothetical protein [Streptomyces sp. MUM 16J]